MLRCYNVPQQRTNTTRRRDAQVRLLVGAPWRTSKLCRTRINLIAIYIVRVAVSACMAFQIVTGQGAEGQR